MEYIDKAMEFRAQGFNCAQATFAAFAERFGMSEEQALKIGASLGGGLAGNGECCGAALGMLMALGLAEGFSKADPAMKQAHNARVREAMQQFQARCGAVRCPELKAAGKDCNEIVRQATEIAAQMLSLGEAD